MQPVRRDVPPAVARLTGNRFAWRVVETRERLQACPSPRIAPTMTTDDRKNLENLAVLLRRQQSSLLLAAARTGGLPSSSTLQRVAELELNISAIDNTLAETR